MTDRPTIEEVERQLRDIDMDAQGCGEQERLLTGYLELARESDVNWLRADTAEARADALERLVREVYKDMNAMAPLLESIGFDVTPDGTGLRSRIAAHFNVSPGEPLPGEGV